MRAPVAIFGTLLWGCAAAVEPDRMHACSSRYPASEESGGTLALDAIALECMADMGMDCDERDFISQAAAECIAREAGLERGISRWMYFMQYDAERKHVIWEVTNQLRIEDQHMVFGRKLIIHAVHGEVLETESYEANQDFLRFPPEPADAG